MARIFWRLGYPGPNLWAGMRLRLIRQPLLTGWIGIVAAAPISISWGVPYRVAVGLALVWVRLAT